MLEAAVILAFGAATGLWLTYAQSRGRSREWHEAAASCGLQIVEVVGGWSPRVRARSGSVSVRLGPLGDKGSSTLIVAEAPAPPDFRGVTIRQQTSLEIGREIETGDKAFDDAFFIQGPARLVLALLDAETRRLMMSLKEQCGVLIQAGELRTVVPGNRNLARVLPRVVALRKRFASPVQVAQRLAGNAAGDPDPGVRLQNLLLLIRELSWSPETDGALRKACSDPVPGIRLRAARELGAEGQAVLLELAESLEDDAVSAEALALLDRELPFDKLGAILGLALRRRRLLAARVCLASLGRRGAAGGVGLLAKVLEREQGELAPAAADALGAIGSPAAEPSLIRALERDDADVRVAAARALGRAGTAAAVPALKEAAERSRLDRDLRRAVRQAIAEIQSRLQGASPGQLSLAGAEAGRLSLPEAEAGELSLADDRAGRLSIRDGEDPGAGA